MISHRETEGLAPHMPLEHTGRDAQKMEAFSKLVGGVAHDFNNLLTVILGYTEILSARRAEDDPDRQLLGEIHKAGERAESLTRQLLAFTRKQVAEPKVLDLNSVVSDTEKMLRRLIGEDILMTTIFAPSLYQAKVDPAALEQMILHLAVRALDVMPRGGRLTIETDNVDLDAVSALSHPEAMPGSYAMLAFSDSGADVPVIANGHHLESPLAPPTFVKSGHEKIRNGKDNDFTLAMVRNIAKQYGGHVEFAVEAAGGSTFKVFFPQTHVPPTATSPFGLHSIPRGSETVLLVEDEDSVRALARHVLQTCGYTVIEASDGAAALQVAQTYDYAIDLLVSDVVMPRLCGRELAERLLLLRPHMRMLFLSGYTADAIERHGLADAKYAFLQKPFTSSTLAQTVRNVLDAAGR